MRAGEHRHHDFVLTRTHIHDRARTAQHNTTQGDTLRNVVRGLMYMVSGKTSGSDALRLLAQGRAARALAWLCFLDDIPRIFFEGPAQGNSEYLLTLSRLIVETHDRAVLIEFRAASS